MKSLIAAGALVLAAGLLTSSASAEEATTAGQAGQSTQAAPDPGSCSPAQFRRLESKGDNFSDLCFQAGSELADIEAEEPNVRSGEIDRSRNMNIIARVPLADDFVGQTGSDLAFQGKYAYVGNYQGFAVYDIRRPTNPERVAQMTCPGSQNDISVYGDLLVLSVDSTRSNDTCDNQAIPGTSPVVWEGVRVFDISDPTDPQFVKSVKTACGSHTHTLAPSKNGRNLFVYVSSYGPSPTTPNCQPPHDLISIVRVPVTRPADSAIVATRVLFPNGGNPPGGYSRETSGCHDITAYPKKDIAAGACMGDGILLDISRRSAPRLIEQVRDTQNFAFWHSATFNNAGTKVVFTDELGGGGGAHLQQRGRFQAGRQRHLRHRAQGRQAAAGVPQLLQDPAHQLQHRELRRPQRLADPGEGARHHGAGLVPGRTVGLRLHQLPQAARARVLRPWRDQRHHRWSLGGTWSSYWYNGRVYSSDITRGLEVFRIKTPWAEKASKVRMDIFNAQSQPSYNG